MPFGFELLLLTLGVASGILSGMLGIGGAILIVPMLLYLPQWLGLGAVDIKSAAAIAVAQVVAASITGAVAHGRHGLVHTRLAIAMASGSTVGALVGGVVSASAPADLMLIIAASLATSAAALMGLRAPAHPEAGSGHRPFNAPVAAACGSAIGLLIGMIGIGSFLMVPTLIWILRQPTRVAMATVLAIAFPTALAGFTGKVITGQIPWMQAGIMVVGAVPGAQLGSWLSARLSTRLLRLAYGIVVLVIAVGLWFDVANRHR